MLEMVNNQQESHALTLNQKSESLDSKDNKIRELENRLSKLENRELTVDNSFNFLITKFQDDPENPDLQEKIESLLEKKMVKQVKYMNNQTRMSELNRLSKTGRKTMMRSMKKLEWVIE